MLIWSKSCPTRIDLYIHKERVLCETFLRPVMYCSKMGIVKARKLGVRSNIFLFSKTAQDCGNRSADMSCRQLGRQGILSLCNSYNLYGPTPICLMPNLSLLRLEVILKCLIAMNSSLLLSGVPQQHPRSPDEREAESFQSLSSG